MHEKPTYAQLEQKVLDLQAELNRWREAGFEEESAIKLRGVLEYSPLGAVLIEPESGRLADMNAIFRRELEIDELDRENLSISDLNFHDQATRRRVSEYLRENADLSDLECSFLFSDGSIEYFRLFSNIVQIGRRSFVLVLFRNITEHKRMKDDLREAKERAESANRAKSEFLANMSHEIRTPLNGMLGMLQLMQMCDLNEELQEYVDNAQLASGNLSTILSDILDLAKIEAGKMTISEHVFNMQDVLNEVYGSFIYQFNQKNLLLVLNVHPWIPDSLVGDSARIRQILFNLVGNSVKFTDKGSVTISVDPLQGAFNAGGTRVRLLFTVSDTGKGLADAEVTSVFDPFVQADSAGSSSIPGTGLGLRIVREFVELMGGNISVVSVQGEGTAIYFTLELGLRQTEMELKEPKSERCGRIEKNSGRKIMVVDDDYLSRIAVSRMLKKHGYAVNEADSGEKALRIAQDEHQDLVLMDIRMPEMDGLETAKRIREMCAAKGHAAPFMVAMTAYAMKGDQERMLQGGMDGYLAKPFAWEDLTAVIATLDRDRGV